MSEKRVMKKRISCLKIKDTYQYYKDHTEKEMLVSQDEYYRTVRKFLNYMADKLLEVGMLKIPCGLGVLQILGYDIAIRIDKKTGKIRGRVDWNETKKLWETCEECRKNKQLVFFTNEHTGFKVYRVFWYTKTNHLVNKSIYRFHTSKTFTKRLAKKIKSGDYAYLYRQKKHRR